MDFSDIEGFTDLVNAAHGSDSIDILLHSPGGDPNATERIVCILEIPRKVTTSFRGKVTTES